MCGRCLTDFKSRPPARREKSRPEVTAQTSIASANRATPARSHPYHRDDMNLLRRRAAAIGVCLAIAPVFAQDSPELRWAGDAEGGAPFVEADPRDPSRVRGF